MKRLLLIIALLAATLRLQGASGDILGAFVETNGCFMQVEIEGMATNVTRFFNGFATNNTPTSTNSLEILFDRMALNDDASGHVEQHLVLGTEQVRLPYPSNALNDSQTNGVNGIWVRVALSRHVFISDSNLVANFRVGAFVNTNDLSASAAATSVTVTNGSVLPYQPAVANWTWRGFRVIDEEYLTLRAVAYHSSAREGRPVRAAEFRVTDSGGTSFTNTQTQMIVGWSMPDATPVVEYVASFATNLFASGKVVCNVKFIPWEGSNVLDSASTGYVEPTPYLCPLTNAVNFPRVRAIVDNATGNDSNGRAWNETYWATNQSPPAFLTIGAAMAQIYATNSSSYGRAGWGGGMILISNGNYGYFGSSVNLANGPDLELLIRPYDTSQTAVAITNFTTDRTATFDKDIVRIKDVFISGNNYIASDFGHYWFDGCTITNHPSGSWMFGDTILPSSVVFTHCRVTNVTGSLNGPLNNNLSTTLIRGCSLGTNVGTEVIYTTAIGNLRNYTGGPSGFIWRPDKSGMATPQNFPAILAYNKTYNNAGTGLSVPSFYTLTNGAAIIQNEFEFSSSDANAGYSVGGGLNTLHSTNVLGWYNNFLSKRMLRAYNDVGSGPSYYVASSWIGNLWENPGIKTDDFAPADGSRTGNWSVYYGVEHAGNYFGFTTNISASSFPPAFSGLRTFTAYVMTSPEDYWGYTSRGGYTGTVTNAPGGNYRLLSSSPLHKNMTPTWVLPYDLDGRPRSTIDPPGAYISGNVRKGLF